MGKPIRHKPKLKLLFSTENEFSNDCVSELYSTIHRDDRYKTSTLTVHFISLRRYAVIFLSRIARHFSLRLKLKTDRSVNFSAQLGCEFSTCIPSYFLSENNYIYMFDAWPRYHGFIARMLVSLNVRVIFFSSMKVHQLFSSNADYKTKSFWIPEGINSNEYRAKEFESRDIDVLEFGRTYKKYHNLIVDVLKENGSRHVFLKDDKRVLFPDREDFINALSMSKICICIPSNVTHPERSEQISTMTLRYLQCMSSKCLIVGILPDEMSLLFDYLPIVPIDWENPGQQLLDILNSYHLYHDLLERNYNEVLSRHQWLHRWEIMSKIISETAAI